MRAKLKEHDIVNKGEQSLLINELRAISVVEG